VARSALTIVTVHARTFDLDIDLVTVTQDTRVSGKVVRISMVPVPPHRYLNVSLRYVQNVQQNVLEDYFSAGISLDVTRVFHLN